MQKIVIWASGKGSNARALLAAAATLDGIKVVGVLTDNPKALVREVASEFGVPSYVINMKDLDSILDLLRTLNPGWALLAGFMRLMPKELLSFFAQAPCNFNGRQLSYRVLNIHPSMLPDYPGLRAVERAYEDRLESSGVTVHFVDEGLDTGPIFIQEAFSISPEETLDEVMAKCHALEHKLYVKVLDWIHQERYL